MGPCLDMGYITTYRLTPEHACGKTHVSPGHEIACFLFHTHFPSKGDARYLMDMQTIKNKSLVRPRMTIVKNDSHIFIESFVLVIERLGQAYKLSYRLFVL